MRSDTTWWIVDGQHRYLALKELGFPDSTQITVADHTSLDDVRITKVRLGDLEVHPMAQKAVIPAVLRRIVSEFNIGALGVLHVVNPQRVATDVASKLFLELNDRGVIGPYERFKNRVQSHDPLAVNAQRVANSVGLKVQKTPANGSVICTDALLSSYRLDGTGAALGQALTTLLAAWGREKVAVTGKLVAGFSKFFFLYPEADAADLAHKVAKHGTASRFEGEIRNLSDLTRIPSTKACVQLLLQEYNRRRRDDRLGS